MSELSKKEIDEAVKKGKMKMFDIPLEVPDWFIEKWKEPAQSEKRAEHNMFIDVKKTDKGINVLAIGHQPELALVLVGIAYGSAMAGR
jgi:hypothetical protein